MAAAAGVEAGRGCRANLERQAWEVISDLAEDSGIPLIAGYRHDNAEPLCGHSAASRPVTHKYIQRSHTTTNGQRVI